MSQSLPESRFYMWRAVFALAHIDGIVTQEERAYAQNYLDRVPFSENQKQTLRSDLEEPQNINEMLIGISEQTDIADFFQFAHMLVWSDGDFDAREQKLLERLTAEQMNRFNKEELAEEIRQARQAAFVRRAIEDAELKRQAREILGVSNVFRSVLPWMDRQVFEHPQPDAFELWRAVFSLVHADHKVTGEEKGFIAGMMDIFHFTPEQRAIIEDDLLMPKDRDLLFKRLETEEQRRRYFYLARAILWADGDYGDKERSAVKRLREMIGPSIEAFSDEIKLLEKRPDMPGNEQIASGSAEVMRQIFHQMDAFYREKQAA